MVWCSENFEMMSKCLVTYILVKLYRHYSTTFQLSLFWFTVLHFSCGWSHFSGILSLYTWLPVSLVNNLYFQSLFELVLSLIKYQHCVRRSCNRMLLMINSYYLAFMCFAVVFWILATIVFQVREKLCRTPSGSERKRFKRMGASDGDNGKCGLLSLRYSVICEEDKQE